MPKRQPLTFNEDELSQDLKKSTAKGVDAFFSPPQPEQKKEDKPKKTKKSPTVKKETKKVSNKAINIDSNIAILQFDDNDIESLRESPYRAQTFRFSEAELEWLKDASYRLSKEVKRGKVAQTDILRVAMKMFENALAINKAKLMEILEKIK